MLHPVVLQSEALKQMNSAVNHKIQYAVFQTHHLYILLQQNTKSVGEVGGGWSVDLKYYKYTQ